VVTADEVGDPQTLHGQLRLNGEVKQVLDTSKMIVSVAELIEMTSSVFDLEPGDVIATGTPAGVHPITPGDRIEAEIVGIGRMSLDVTSSLKAPPWSF